METAPLCFVSSNVRPSCLADIIQITLFMLSFSRALFRRREPRRLTTTRIGNNRECNGRGQKETAPSTILTKQFKRLSRLLGASKCIQREKRVNSNGVDCFVWAMISRIKLKKKNSFHFLFRFKKNVWKIVIFLFIYLFFLILIRTKSWMPVILYQQNLSYCIE